MLTLALLGPVSASLAGGPLLHFPTQRAQALLLYLAVERERTHRRETLMNLLWPDIAPVSAQQSLRQALYLLRQTLAPHAAASPFLADRQTIQLDPTFLLTLDCERFLILAGSPEPAAWSGAIDLYRGDFLADFYLPDSEPFEEWAGARRAHFRQVALDTCAKLTEHHLGEGNFDAAVTVARREIEIDDLRENAHRRLMTALARGGRRQEALTQYETLCQLLRKELDVEPAAETEALHQAIRSGYITPPPTFSPPPSSPPTSSPPHNLPARLTPFIGRQVEIAALNALLAKPDARLITVLGPGGMGKTRLALAVGEAQLTTANVRQQFPHGVFFVDLAPLSEAAHLPSAAARALDIPLRGGAGQSTLHEQVRDYLREKRALLIFDNFEHLLPAADLVADYLAAAPGLKTLITSRERLNLRVEQVFALGGLDLPGEADVVETFTAAQLFVQAAHRLRPDFRLDKEDRQRLVQICRQVAGMPLALELAAAWVDTLSLADIVAEIERSLDFLATDLRDVPSRHRSLRAAFDASWQLLNADEQAVFVALSVFRGGFTRAAAQRVAVADSALSARLLARLVSKSLLQFDATRGRYQLHELLRQYAAARLIDRGPAGSTPDAFQLRDRHADYYLDLLRRLEPDVKGAQQDAALNQIEDDFENILLAWHWGVMNDWCDQLLEAIDSLGVFFQLRGRHQDGLHTLAVISERWSHASAPTNAVLVLLARCLAWQAVLSADSQAAVQRLEQAQALLVDQRLIAQDTATHEAFVHLQLARFRSAQAPATAGIHAERSLQIYQQIGDGWGIMSALLQKGWSQFWLGDYEAARQSFDQVLTLVDTGHSTIAPAHAELDTGASPAHEPHWAKLWSWQSLFTVAMAQGDLAAADQATRTALTLLPVSDKPDVRLERISIEAYYLHNAGQFSQAAAAFDELLRVNQGLGRLRDLFEGSYTEVAMTDLHMGNYTAAQMHIQSALNYMRQHSSQNHSRIGFCFHVLAMLALVRGEFVEAERLLTEASQIYNQHTTNIDLAGALAYLALARHGLGDAAGAWRRLRDSLEISVPARAFLPASEALVTAALLLAEDEELEQAAAIYALVTRHPFVGNSQFFADVAGTEIRRQISVLSAETLVAAKRQGESENMWDAAARLAARLRHKENVASPTRECNCSPLG